jgi:AraC-like DNA-binding protein
VLRLLGDAALSPAAVAAHLGVTPRYVHMLFEPEGVSFAQFVLGRRLLCARRLVADPRMSGRSISAIAFDAGFGDLSTFNRNFRLRFGCTPTEVRDAGHGKWWRETPR